MAKPPPQTGSGIIEGLHRWFTGAFLLVVMMLALFANALIFSARSFQHNFAVVSGTGTGVLSMTLIRDISREMAVYEAQSAPMEKQLADLQRQVDAANMKLDGLSRQIDDGAKRLAPRIADIEKKLAISADRTDQTLPSLQSRVERLEGNPRADRRDVAALREALNPLLAVNSQITQATNDKQMLESQAVGLQSQLNSERQHLIASKASFKGDFNQVKAEIDSLSFTSPFGLGLALAQVHPTFLSTMLVCSMGALGAILFLFPAYVANNPDMRVTFVTIIIRMAFGMVTAFAFFIVANSAIAAFGFTASADANASGSQSLNPFTISGLGVIAGVMADDIARWIHERGVYMFASGGQAARNTLGDLARGAGARDSGGLVNPHGGPQDPA